MYLDSRSGYTLYNFPWKSPMTPVNSHYSQYSGPKPAATADLHEIIAALIPNTPFVTPKYFAQFYTQSP